MKSLPEPLKFVFEPDPDPGFRCCCEKQFKYPVSWSMVQFRPEIDHPCSSFNPGRRLKNLDLVVNGAGVLGVITDASKASGVQIAGPNVDILGPFKATTWAVLQVNLKDFLGVMGRRKLAFQMPHLHLHPFIPEGWPKRLQFISAPNSRRIATWALSAVEAEDATKKT